MDFVHLHLLLNHFPIIGIIVGTGLFLSSFLVHAESLRRSSLIVFVAIALLTIPAFVTGMGAQVKDVEEGAVAEALVQRHLGSAELSIWFVEVTGALAAIALWRSGRQVAPARWNTVALVGFSLMTVLVMARTGSTGGSIRHEAGSVVPATAVEQVMSSIEPQPREFTRLMIANKWWWAFMMAMHFVGLVLLVGTIGLFNLRILGFAKQIPMTSLNALVPWGAAGFGINVLTGMLAFIGMPAYYTYNIAFILKLGVIVLAAGTLALFYLTAAFTGCQDLEPGAEAPWQAKSIAAASLVLWLAVIVLGRYIQPLENSIPR